MKNDNKTAFLCCYIQVYTQKYNLMLRNLSFAFLQKILKKLQKTYI